MLAEAYIENNEMRVINFPKDAFKGKYWKINIEPIEEIKDDIEENKNSNFFDEFQINLTQYKFNRDEANER